MKNSPSRVRNFPVKKFISPHAVLLCMVLLSLWCGSAHPVLAGPEALTSEKSTKAVTVQDVWSLPGIFGGGVKTTEDYTEGNVFLVVPVISTVGQDGLLSGDVLFIEPYSSWGEQGEVAASLGLGWRHYFTTQSVSAVTKHDGHQAGFFEEGVYVGANVFVDMLDTQFNNQFWQLGVGAEVGTRYLEIRGNYYIPLTDKQLAYEQRRKYSYQTTSSSTSQQVSAGTPYAVGNTLAQDLQYTTLTTTTTSTTTIEQLFRLYEEGMEGWDIQASVLVPGLDRWMDVFLIGGYFSFDNQPFGPQTGGSGNVKGWKAGLEVRPVPAVVLNATWYEDKRFVGSDWLYGMRLEIPFEMGDLGDGKGFWDRVGAAFTPRRRHLAERLVEPVRRQNTAIKVGNETEEKTDVSTSVKRVTKVVSQSPQQLVLADDVIFVNNGSATTTGIAAGSASGTGTAEQPVDTIQAGTDIAVTNSVATSRIWNVYTQGGVDYLTGATVPGGGGVRYIGSHMPLQGGDKTYMTGHIPTILGSLGLQAPNGGTYFGVFGYVFNGGTILAENYNEVEIEGNTLNSSNGTGITVRGSTVTTSDVKVLNNFVNNATGSGIVITAEGITQMQSQISGNAVGAAGAYGIHLQAFDEATLDALVSGNQIQAPELDGIRVDALNEAAVNAILDGNAIVDAGVNGIALRTADAADLTATVDDNYISNAGTTGLQVRSENSVPGIGTGITVDITGNAILESGTHGVDLYTSANDLTATLTGNLIRGTVLYYGTYLHGDGGTVHATFTGNSYVENINGFHVYTDTDGASIDATFEGNYFNKGEVWLDRTDDLAALDLTFRQNHFLNSYLTAWSPSNLTAEGNLFESNGGSGYTGLTVFNNMSNSTSLVKDNYFTGYSWLYIIANEGAMDITVTGNSFVDTGREGVYIEATGGNLQADISGNFMSGTSSGVSILSIASSPLTHSTITMENNMIQNTSSHGIGFQNFAGGTLDLTISGNQLSNIGGDALNFYAPFSDGVHNVLVSGNAIYNSSIIIHDNPFAWTPGTFNVQGNYISQGAIVAFNPQNLLVTGNTIEWAPGSALNFNFEGGGNVTATGNYIVDAGEAGISLSKTSGMDLVTANFTGNAIISPSLYGISVRTEMDGSVDVTIADNFIQDTNLSGVYLNATNNMGGILAHVSGNQIEAWGGDGITVEAFNSARVDATIHGNAITNSGWNGISLVTDSSAMLTATVSNNYISYSNEMGVNVLAGNTTAGTGITVHITGNSILNTSRNTVNLLSQPGEVNATVTGNLLEGGYHLAYLYSTGGPINATFTGNSISGSSGQHVRIESGDGTINATLAQNSFITGGISAVRDKELGALNLTVEQNYFERGFIEATNVNTLTVVGNAMEHSWFVWPGGVNVSTTMDSTIVVQDNYLMNSDTIKIAAHDLANVTATITGNQINYTNFDGIVLQTSGSANITATISGNAILSDPQGSGIVLTSTNDVGGITATISGNHIETPVVDGIRVEALNYATVDVTIDGNAIIDAGGNGISLITEWYANLNATVSNNYISNAGNMGVNAQAMNISEGTGITLDLTGNTILNSGYHGVNLYGYSWGEVTATLTGNAISGSLYYGTFLDVDGGSVNAIFTGNYFDDNDSGYSVRMETNGGTINATLEQNSINNGGISAVRNYQWDTLNLTVQQNQFNDGWVEASSPTTLTVVGNTMQGTWQWFGGVNMFTYMDTAVLVQDNYFANTGGVSIASYDLASTTATVTGNLFANALGDAVILSTNGYGSITADISGNAISGGAGSGVSFVSNGYDLQPTITATVTNNVIQNTAVGILAWNYNNGTMDLTITGNHISGTTSDAVQLMTNGGAVSNMVVSNNMIIGNRIVVSEDLYMPTLGSSYTVQGNHVTNGSIEAYNVQGILVTGNTVEGSPGDAMAFGWDRPGSATVTGNTIVNAGGAGIYISKGSGLDTATVSVTNNVINGAATHGIWSSVVGEGSLDLTISSNGIQNVGGDGIRFQADNYAGPGITVSTLDGNYVNQAGENGIAILSANEGDVTVSNFNGNLITDTVAGSHLVIEQGALGTVQVTGDVDNTASPSPNPAPAGETLKFNGTTPTVNFQLNGGSITMPVDMP